MRPRRSESSGQKNRKTDRLSPKVIALTEEGRSYRWIARDLGISKNTVADIVRRHKSNA
nr:helix-turn-helix domain-containing protein [Brucella gallinifaecis]